MTLRLACYKNKKRSLTKRKYIAKFKSLIFDIAFSYLTYKNCCKKGKNKYGNT